MKLETLDFVQEIRLGNPLMGYGFGAKVSCNDKPFKITILVIEGYLAVTYREITSDMLTHFNGTNFTVNATGDIIDLLDDSTRITKICPVVSADSPDIELKLNNTLLTIHIYPSGGVELVKVTESKTSVFSPE